MKIAVMTLKDSPNYGGILQAYALQYVLNNSGGGYTCDLIDYMNDGFRHKFTFFGKPTGMSNIYWLFKKVQYPLMIKMMRKMMPFYNHMSLTKKITDKADLVSLNDDYDAFICGSDQVWACDLNYYDDSYFLSFVNDNKIKVAYAASFGRTVGMLTNKERSFIAPNLLRFDDISVREESGVDVVKALTGQNACAVLDPTLLLSKEEWELVSDKQNREPYLLCYLMQSRRNDTDALKDAKKLAKRKNLKIIKICRGLTSVLWGETVYVPTVEEWLSLFANAAYVITNSFHGVAFSVNFNRPFTAYIEGEPTEGRNSRIWDLCNQMGLLSRVKVIGDSHEPDFGEISYEIVNPRLDALREQSKDYLMAALMNTKN